MSGAEFGRSLLAAGLLEAGGVDGLYHRSFGFERIVRGVESYVSGAGSVEASRRFYFAPVMARTTLEGSGYLTSFPDLIGTVSSFTGSEAELRNLLEHAAAGSEWAGLMAPTNVALCPAACHSVYPLMSGVPISADGQRFEVQGTCFRHEPSDDPARMQSFRQHEFVYLGTADAAREHRDRWLARGLDLLGALELDVESVVANDPFFGRAGRLLAAGQREKALKYEIVAPISSEVAGAIASANYHEDHFSSPFDLSLESGDVCHTSCIGFGLERITLALLWRHGLDIELWPDAVAGHLGLGTDRHDLGAAR